MECVEEQKTKCATLIAEAKSAISLLQERRAALISATVTGKIVAQVKWPASERKVEAGNLIAPEDNVLVQEIDLSYAILDPRISRP